MQKELLKVKEKKTELESKIGRYSREYAKMEGHVFDGGYYDVIYLDSLSEDESHDIKNAISELTDIYKALNIRVMFYVDEKDNMIYL